MSNTMNTLLTAALLVVVGCGGDDRGRELTVFRDSGNIRIAENIAPDDSAAHVWWTVRDAELDIGGEDAVEPYAVHRVTAVLRQPDGSIVVGSSSSADVRVFSATGQHLRTTGRKGGGPGEFQSISSLERAPGDSIFVFDQQGRRLTLLDPAGSFVGVIATDPEVGPSRVYGRFADGTLLAAPTGTFVMPPEGTPQDKIHRQPVRLARFGTDGLRIDSLGTYPGQERIMRIAMGPNNQVSAVNIIIGPFMKAPTYVAMGDEFFVGAQDGPEILVYDKAGALRRIVRTGRAAEAVTQKHLDAQFERSVSQASPDRQTEMRASGPPDYPNGGFVPPYGELIADRAGNLWAADYPDPLDQPGRWTVYGPDGGVVARVALPERFRPFDIGADYVLGREFDDLDVEHVRLYRIVK